VVNGGISAIFNYSANILNNTTITVLRLVSYDIAEYSNGAFPTRSIVNWLCSNISSANNPNGGNWQGVCNDQLDALLKEQAITPDTQKRINLFRQISKLMYDQVYYIGLWKDPDLWSVNSRLQNVRLSGATPFWNAHEWITTK
jgi:peptide/nickel transport system substrate-binding protein